MKEVVEFMVYQTRLTAYTSIPKPEACSTLGLSVTIARWNATVEAVHVSLNHQCWQHCGGAVSAHLDISTFARYADVLVMKQLTNTWFFLTPSAVTTFARLLQAHLGPSPFTGVLALFLILRLKNHIPWTKKASECFTKDYTEVALLGPLLLTPNFESRTGHSYAHPYLKDQNNTTRLPEHQSKQQQCSISSRLYKVS